MTDFGRSDPREMPPHFFYGSLRIDYRSAVPADPDKQTRSICPRYWYIDAAFACSRCGNKFVFTADEQRAWYEEYGFWIDSLPKHCLDCRRALRVLKAVRQEYDRDIQRAVQGDEMDLKRRLANVIDQLYEIGGRLPIRIHENRRRLARQLENENRSRSSSDD